MALASTALALAAAAFASASVTASAASSASPPASAPASAPAYWFCPPGDVTVMLVAAGETSDYPDLSDLIGKVAVAAGVQTRGVCATETEGEPPADVRETAYNALQRDTRYLSLKGAQTAGSVVLELQVCTEPPQAATMCTWPLKPHAPRLQPRIACVGCNHMCPGKRRAADVA